MKRRTSRRKTSGSKFKDVMEAEKQSGGSALRFTPGEVVWVVYDEGWWPGLVRDPNDPNISSEILENRPSADCIMVQFFGDCSFNFYDQSEEKQCFRVFKPGFKESQFPDKPERWKTINEAQMYLLDQKKGKSTCLKKWHNGELDEIQVEEAVAEVDPLSASQMRMGLQDEQSPDISRKRKIGEVSGEEVDEQLKELKKKKDEEWLPSSSEENLFPEVLEPPKKKRKVVKKKKKKKPTPKKKVARKKRPAPKKKKERNMTLSHSSSSSSSSESENDGESDLDLFAMQRDDESKLHDLIAKHQKKIDRQTESMKSKIGKEYEDIISECQELKKSTEKQLANVMNRHSKRINRIFNEGTKKNEERRKKIVKILTRMN